MMHEYLVFRCDCHQKLVADLSGSNYTRPNMCPKCRKHMRVSTSQRRGGLATFVYTLKYPPRHKIAFETLEEFTIRQDERNERRF